MQRTIGRATLLPSLVVGLALGFCGISFAAEPSEPQQFVAQADAQPIPGVEAMVPTNGLRWQSKRLNTVADFVEPEESMPARPVVSTGAPAPLRAGWNITRVDPNVRPAQALAADPFKDPFGDKQSAQRNSTLTLAPSRTEPVAEELPPPRSMSALRRSTSQAPMLNAAQPTDGLPASGLGASQPGQSATSCDRVYNDHNCCDLESRCHDFRARLLADNIRRISLDITPRYNPSADVTPEQEEAERTDKLRLLESRPWRNRRGQLAATGKMTNIHNGFVIVADDSGNETGRISIHDLGEDELCYVTSWWELPGECGLGGLRHTERQWIPHTFAWHASGLCHKPLYFEEVQLERYGHTAGPIRQPILSAAHFCKNLICLPYHMGINPVNECQYALGYYRPGSCAPWMIQPIPLSLRGAIAETAVILGGVYVIP